MFPDRMSEPKDRRATPREQVHLVATIELDGKEIGCGISRDASGSGLLLFTHLDIAQGTELTLRLFVPQEDEPRRVEAMVLRSERIRPQEEIVWAYRMALVLRDPPPDLQELVQRLTKRPPSPA
jgi:hypothetical protein